MLIQRLVSTYCATDGSEQDLAATALGTDGRLFLLGSTSHDRALCSQMAFHADIGVLAGGDSNGGVAQRTWSDGGEFGQWHSGRGLTIGGNAIVLGLVILRALVVLDLEMGLAVGLEAMLAPEGQEIDEVAGVFCALLSDGEQLGVVLGHGRRFIAAMTRRD